MTPASELGREVARRAAGRCESCRMHQSLQGATFHVEHIIPRSLGGRTQGDNLAWACPSCKLHKSNRVELQLPGVDEAVPLFNPRVDDWQQHFRGDGFLVVGISATGRATVDLLQLNHDRRLKIRQAEAMFGLFPPDAG